MNFIIFPHQLFENVNNIKNAKKIYLIEHPIFFGYREEKLNFNKKKLVLHRASMKFYQDYLRKKTTAKIIYKDFDNVLKNGMFNGIKEQICYYDPVDHLLQKEIDKHGSTVRFEPLNFLTSIEEFSNYYDTVKNRKKPFFQTGFYKWQRERLHILMKNNKPIGGKLTFDSDNRNPLPKNINIPPTNIPKWNKYVKNAINYIEKNFSKNYGEYDDFWCPIDFAESKKWLELFLKERLSKFGTYQDAITIKSDPFLFHSGISSSLNIGLLDPLYIINRVIEYGMANKITMNNIEGFVRQVLGWREFSRFTYIYIYDEMTKTNYFNCKNKINNNFYTGSTGMLVLDNTIQKAFRNGYLHHIERLMIIGSLTMMMQIKPYDMYKWFMEFAVDSYDWVMINNVYSMALYSDGGLTVSKAYAASANYEMIKRSDYPKGEWVFIWNALYWNFIGLNKDKMRKMGRFGPIQVKNWERKSDKEKEKFKKDANLFIKKNVL